MPRLVVISGCSGGGKSTLLTELSRRGFDVVEEPGRRIVAEALQGDGAALPWHNPAAFARCAVEMTLQDYAAAMQLGDPVFFDRGLIDAAVALDHATSENQLAQLSRRCRYHPMMFMAPPWPEIYARDAERRHGLDAALEEYDRLIAGYTAQGYQVVILPKTGVSERADFVLSALARS
jgi:predicted ATPase